VIQFRRRCSQTRFDVSQAFAKGELAKRQAQKLIATRKPAMAAIASVPPHTRGKFVSRQPFHELSKNQFPGMHQVPSTLKKRDSRVADRSRN
jgi:hypothetical protein